MAKSIKGKGKKRVTNWKNKQKHIQNRKRQTSATTLWPLADKYSCKNSCLMWVCVSEWKGNGNLLDTLQLCKNYFYDHFASQNHKQTTILEYKIFVSLWRIVLFRMKWILFVRPGIFIYIFFLDYLAIKLNTNHFYI